MEQAKAIFQWLLYKGKTYAVGIGLLGYLVSIESPNLYVVLGGIIVMLMTLRHGLSKRK